MAALPAVIYWAAKLRPMRNPEEMMLSSRTDATVSLISFTSGCGTLT